MNGLFQASAAIAAISSAVIASAYTYSVVNPTSAVDMCQAALEDLLDAYPKNPYGDLPRISGSATANTLIRTIHDEPGKFLIMCAGQQLD